MKTYITKKIAGVSIGLAITSFLYIRGFLLPIVAEYPPLFGRHPDYFANAMVGVVVATFFLAITIGFRLAEIDTKTPNVRVRDER